MARLQREPLFEHGLTANALCDLEGTITDVNARFRALCGALEGHSLEELFTDPQRFVAIRAALEANALWEGDFVARRGDGSTFPAHGLLTALIDDWGNRVGAACSLQDITRQHETDEALLESERRFRATFEQAAVGMAHLSPDGRFLRVNDRLCSILGFSREALLTRAWQDVTCPDDLGVGLGQVQSVLDGTSDRYSAEKRYQRGDGTVAWVQLTFSLVRTASGAPDFFVAVLENIDERKHAEQSLRSSEEKFSRAFQASPEAITITDLSTDQFVEVNDAFEEITGYTRAEVVGKTSAQIDLHADPASRAELIRLAHAGQSIHNFEYRFRKKNGELGDAQLNFDTFEMEGRAFAIAINTDVTERRKAEETLRVSEAKFRTAFMTGLDAIYLATLEEGRVVDVNPQFTTVFGFTREETMGRTSVELGLFVDPSDRARVVAGLRSGAAVRDLELRLRKKTGELIQVSLSVAVLTMGGVPHVLGVARDITERERARAEQKLLEGQLRQAQKMESIGRLAGGVAHDFNNLLSVIISYTNFAIKSVREGDPLRDDLEEVKQAGERATALTRQLLAFSRKQLLAPEALDLNQVVTGIERMVRRLLGEDIDIDVRLGDGLGTTLADPGQLEQLIMNLVVNARDAMPHGGTLTIETADRELGERDAVKPGRYVMLAVTDTGCGMDAATRERIFEPFFTTKGLGKGTGLGLSTVFGIVKQSGGEIRVTSEEGRGSTFQVFLPRVDAQTSSGLRAPSAPVKGGTETVLIVEDELSVRRIAERILRSAGYKVLSASSGGDALVLCEKHGPELKLLLTDVVMPQMSGRELADRLGKTWPALKVVYMSGYTDDAISQHGVLAPGTHFVGKPFAAADLTQKVREALDAA